jgi:hypothetical protein
MNTAAIVAVANELAKLTPQEHLLASELAQTLRVGGKQPRVVEASKRASRQNTQWKEDEEIRVLELEESMRHASKSKRKTLVRDAARELGRSEAAVVKHIWEMNNKGQKA